MTSKRRPGVFDPKAERVIIAPQDSNSETGFGARSGSKSGAGPETSPLFPTAAHQSEGEPPARRRGSGRWLVLFATAVVGLGLTALFDLVWTELQAALSGSDLFAWLSLAFMTLAFFALLAFCMSELRGLRGLKRAKKLKDKAGDAKTRSAPRKARSFARLLINHMKSIPETARDRARLRDYLSDVMDANDIMALTEKTLLVPRDQQAIAIIRKNALRASTITALSPRAILDILAILYLSAKTIGDVARIYGTRPGFLGLCRIAKLSIMHLAITGAYAAGETVLQQVVGHGLASRISARLGEGVLNGLMTIRLGLAVMSVCRPMAFDETTAPDLKQVAKGLFKTGATKKDLG